MLCMKLHCKTFVITISKLFIFFQLLLMHPNDLQISNSVGKSNTPCFYHPQAEISKLHKENHKQKRMNSKGTEVDLPIRICLKEISQEMNENNSTWGKGSSSYHLCVEYFFQFCFKTAADFVYISESNENWKKYSIQRW